MTVQSIDTVRRDKLYRLWKTVTDDNDFQRTLERDTVISSNFLSRNGIVLLKYDIEQSDAGCNLAHESPILFRPASRDFFQRYPIDVNGFDTPSDRDYYEGYHKRGPKTDREGFSRALGRKEFTGIVANYLEKWAVGTFPRQIPAGLSPHLPDNYGIRKPLHPGGLYAGGYFVGKGWAADVFEYKEKPDGNPYPHVLMLSRQRHMGHNNKIMRGELAVILTAMRSRAFQKVEQEGEDDDDYDSDVDDEEEEEEDDEDDDAEFEQSGGFQDDGDDEEENDQDKKYVPKLIFEDEKRFPVLLISCVGPQHARIIHAVMHGFNLIIRQTPIYSFETRNVDVLDLFSTYLLSTPLEEVEEVANEPQSLPGS